MPDIIRDVLNDNRKFFLMNVTDMVDNFLKNWEGLYKKKEMREIRFGKANLNNPSYLGLCREREYHGTKYCRVKKVAEILRCRHSTVLDWIKRGRVKARLSSRVII